MCLKIIQIWPSPCVAPQLSANMHLQCTAAQSSQRHVCWSRMPEATWTTWRKFSKVVGSTARKEIRWVESQVQLQRNLNLSLTSMQCGKCAISCVEQRNLSQIPDCCGPPGTTIDSTNSISYGSCMSCWELAHVFTLQHTCHFNALGYRYGAKKVPPWHPKEVHFASSRTAGGTSPPSSGRCDPSLLAAVSASLASGATTWAGNCCWTTRLDTRHDPWNISWSQTQASDQMELLHLMSTWFK